jgi:hypothetical protein
MSFFDDDPLDDYDADSFGEAAAYLARLLPPGSPGLTALAEALAHLADAGLIVTPAIHDRTCNAYAEQLRQCEAAADELHAALYRDTERGCP